MEGIIACTAKRRNVRFLAQNNESNQVKMQYTPNNNRVAIVKAEGNITLQKQKEIMKQANL